MATDSVIIAVALNPAIDRTLEVPGFTAGGTNRVAASRVDPGGKGINVARVLRAFETPVEVVGFLGGANSRLITAHLDSMGVPHQFVAIEGETRVNLKLVDPLTGALTEVNDLGFRVEPVRLEQMTRTIQDALPRSDVLVLAGSLPTGVPPTYYRDLARMARAAGVSVILDADGEPLRASLPARPTLIKPNQGEAERLLGRSLRGRTEVVAAARELLTLGPELVVVSCGAAGAALASTGGAWWASPPPITPSSAVGAGDSMVAALARALVIGLPPGEALRLATAAGAATASLPGTQVAGKALVDRLLPGVQITSV